MNSELKEYQDPSKHPPGLLLSSQVFPLIFEEVKLGTFFTKHQLCISG